MTDSVGNAPDSIAVRTSIVWGMPPPPIQVTVPHAVVRRREEMVPPSGEPAITMIFRNPSDDRWTIPGSTLPEGIDTRFGGLWCA